VTGSPPRKSVPVLLVEISRGLLLNSLLLRIGPWLRSLPPRT
jgi:hypothetical protein